MYGKKLKKKNVSIPNFSWKKQNLTNSLMKIEFQIGLMFGLKK